MPPNQPVPPPVGGSNQYDFIMQDPQKPKRSLLPSGASRKQRLIVGGLGLGGVLTLFIIILVVIFSIGGSNAQPMIELAQTQNEIARISNAGTTKARSPATLNFAQNAYLTTTTGQQQTLAYLQKEMDQKINTKQLAATQSASTDETLKNAEQAGTYDTVLYTILYQQLTAYRDRLTTTYQGASGAKQKELLKKLYDSVVTLLKNQPAPATSS